MVNSESDPIIRRAPAAIYLGISVATLHRLVAAGKLPPPIRIAANATGWRRSVLNGYIVKCEGTARDAVDGQTTTAQK